MDDKWNLRNLNIALPLLLSLNVHLSFKMKLFIMDNSIAIADEIS